MSKKNPQRKRIDALSFKIDEIHINPESGTVELNLHFNLKHKELKSSLSHNNLLLATSFYLKILN